MGRNPIGIKCAFCKKTIKITDKKYYRFKVRDKNLIGKTNYSYFCSYNCYSKYSKNKEYRNGF